MKLKSMMRMRSKKRQTPMEDETYLENETSAENETVMNLITPMRRLRGKLKSKRIIAAVVLTAVLGSSAGVHFLWSGKSVQAAAEYTTIPVLRQSLSQNLTGTGTLTPVNQYKITPLVTGKVLECTFQEGDKVEAGQLLYRIDPGEAQKNVEQAELSLRQAQLSAEQQSEELSALSVKAEQAGTITEVLVKVGDKVDAGTKIATLRNDATMLLTVPFNAEDASKFTVGQAASVTVNGSFETITGSVKEIDAGKSVGEGFQVTKNVIISVPNPGALSPTAAAAAIIGGIASNNSANFAYSTEGSITALTGGKVAQLNVRVGSLVSAGTVVAKLSSTALKNQKENADIAVQQAQVGLENAKASIESYNITAPISGTVISRDIKAGDSLGSGSGTNAMAVIYDLSALVFTISLDELDITKVSVGQKVEVRVDALSGQTFYGVVENISMAGNTDKGKTTYPVTVKIENAPEELLPGMNVNASIVMAEAENALTVPVTAVQAGDVVYVENEKGKTYSPEETMDAPEGFHSVKVTTGVSDGIFVEIKSGLAENDMIYNPVSPTDGGAINGFGDDGGEADGSLIVDESFGM